MAGIFAIFVDSSTLVLDGSSASPDSHPLVNGLTIQAGAVGVTGVKTDKNVPMTAVFFPADESGSFPGTATVGTLTSGLYPWSFSWADLPELGPNALLRLEEIQLDNSGATVNYTINVVADNQNDPGLDPVTITIPGSGIAPPP